MKQIILCSALAVFTTLSVFSQKTPPQPDAKGHTQSIVIRKTGTDKEKTTIVIDGDNITINGKPLREYKGNIQVTEDKGGDYNVMSALPPLPPVPAYPHGGAKSYSSSFNVNGNRAFLGVYTEADDAGAKIKSVTKNSPAEKAGLKEGDIITKIDKDQIDDSDDLMDIVGKYKPSDKVTVTYLREKKENNVSVTLDKNAQQTFAWSSGDKDFARNFRNFTYDWNSNKPRLGMRVEDTESGNGIKVMDIDDEESPAGKAGLQEEDVITEINGKKISAVKDAKDVLEDIKQGDTVTISYSRKGTSQTATVHIPKPIESSDL